ncbi:MAG: glycosyltransferase [Acidobacteria bacterium]|nr:glycosyltransferase [Acidobacteriota bacterium]
MIRTVAYFLDSAHFGGTEQVVLQILSGLDRGHWRPVLFHHPEPGLAPLLREAENLNVERRPVPRMQSRHSLVAWLPRFIGELRAEHPAVFHAHLNSPLSCKDGLIAAGLARVPAIVATAHLFMELPLTRFVRAQQRFVATAVDRYIAVSHEVAGRLRRTFYIPARKISVVHNGIYPTRFNGPVNTALRATLTGSSKQPVVLILARLDQQKGHRYLLEAAALVPEAVFVLAGDGPERANLEAQAQRLGLNNRVLFLGYRQDAPDLLACCDLFVLPSLFEGLPLSILEAMAANKPVIASAISGNNEAIVHGETGLLVPPADPTALAAAIRMVLSNRELARRLAAAGRARVYKEFSAEGMVQRVTHIYEQILSSHEKVNGRH